MIANVILLYINHHYIILYAPLQNIYLASREAMPKNLLYTWASIIIKHISLWWK